MNGKVEISSVLNSQFYKNTVFPDISVSTPAKVTAKKISTPAYTSLKDYVDSKGYRYSNVYICPAVNEKISDLRDTNKKSEGLITYEFDTYDNKHVVVDESCIDQQVSMDQPGDYGDVELEQVAPGKDITYLSYGEQYYIQDYSRNLLTITIPME